MTDDTLRNVRAMIGERIAELEARVPKLAPSTISEKMAAIRSLAAEHGLAALEGLADWSAHHAMMPGHKVATATCLQHMDEALASQSPNDRQTILAALALRLH